VNFGEPRIGHPPNCALPAIWAGVKGAGSNFIGGPKGSDPTGDIEDAMKDKNVQRAAIGVAYQTANSVRFLAPVADAAADFIPVVGEVALGLQGADALYEGGRAAKESLDKCRQNP
jgi:hypothetical protein